MTYASVNFPTSTAFKKAVETGQPVVLFNPELQIPAINGVVTVHGPWDLTRHDKETRSKQHGWRATVRVRDMVPVEVLVCVPLNGKRERPVKAVQA